MNVGNMLAGVPADLPAELIEVLLRTPGVRLERIVSRQHASPPGFWYDQDEDEWVLLLTGSAALRLHEPDELLTLQPGDYLLIPAHRKHRVERTDPQVDTIWLALFITPESS